MFSVCTLHYGDYMGLAGRCLDSIRDSWGGHKPELVQDLRIGLNSISVEVYDFIAEKAKQIETRYGVPTYLFVGRDNKFKYPMMRRMLYSGPALADMTMWFDDDSYLTVNQASWWQLVQGAIADHDMLGQVWSLAVQGRQWDWITRQTWFNAQVGPPPLNKKGQPSFSFCQGAWWTIYSTVLQRLNWPIPELRHCGGDSMFGEVCRHRGIRIRKFDTGVRINADAYGRHSKSKRRGHDEKEIGVHYQPGQPVDLSHQDFDLQIIRASEL